MATLVEAAVSDYPVIRKQPEVLQPLPNLTDYEAVRRSFRWEKRARCWTGCPAGAG